MDVYGGSPYYKHPVIALRAEELAMRRVLSFRETPKRM